MLGTFGKFIIVLETHKNTTNTPTKNTTNTPTKNTTNTPTKTYI